MKYKSQWDFGELFPRETTRRVWTVTELTAAVRQLLERQIGEVWVTGEISNLRQQSSGHVYFTLKDAAAQVNCVLFRGEAGVNRSLIQDGQKVILFGAMTVYEPRGQYQLRVSAVELHGQGALQLAFERLKQKLQAEGLFAPEHKRPIPRYPHRVGVVTSPTGAALQDILHVMQRRAPLLELLLAPCRVQGEGAASEIASAIRLLNRISERNIIPPPNQTTPSQRETTGVDVILVTRGGGSLEDLWAFNEEVVARAIYESAIPVISAVGHEIDFTISDMAADLRAATPSAAAELLTEGYFASGAFLSEALARMRMLAERRLALEQQALRQVGGRLARVHPRRLLETRAQRLDELALRQQRLGQSILDRHRLRFNLLGQRLGGLRPSRWITQAREGVIRLRLQLGQSARRGLDRLEQRRDRAQARLELLSPWHVLARGYSLTMDEETGAIIRRWDQVKEGQKILTRLEKGKVFSAVQKTAPDQPS
jgi:exodeoxyribonuclease VII large subunit